LRKNNVYCVCTISVLIPAAKYDARDARKNGEQIKAAPFISSTRR
jgi:hypothetical protein